MTVNEFTDIYFIDGYLLFIHLEREIFSEILPEVMILSAENMYLYQQL